MTEHRAVLIAGCGGVGGALAEALTVAGHAVWAIRRSDTPLPKGVNAWRADLRQQDTLVDPPADFEEIFYTASPDERSEEAYRAVYIDGLHNVAQHVANANTRIFLTTSTAVYAQDAGEWVDEGSPTTPTRNTARILLEAEQLLAKLGDRHVAVRLAGIYGPGRTRLLRQVMGGDSERSNRFTNRIHIRDCAGMLQQLMNQRDTERVYVGVDDLPVRQAEVVDWLADQLHAPTPGPATLPPGDSGKRCNNQRLRDTGYSLRYPTFKDGYAEMIADARS